MKEIYLSILLLLNFEVIMIQPWYHVSNCETLSDKQSPIVPQKATECTHILMNNHKSCCFVNRKKDGVDDNNLCISFDNSVSSDRLFNWRLHCYNYLSRTITYSKHMWNSRNNGTNRLSQL